MALVFYHRGQKLKPKREEFRLGIQKAQEAIDNSVGGNNVVCLVKLTSGVARILSYRGEAHYLTAGNGVTGGLV